VADRAPRILLVDDEQPIQTLLSFPLQRDGYEVVHASDGREALARFSEQTFDLVVLDVMLPRMDGLEVCKRLRAKGETVPIIMLTAQDRGDRQGPRARARRRRLHHQAVLDARVPLAA
jgi:DNA-binding response OmpR family regulator